MDYISKNANYREKRLLRLRPFSISPAKLPMTPEQKRIWRAICGELYIMQNQIRRDQQHRQAQDMTYEDAELARPDGACCRWQERRLLDSLAHHLEASEKDGAILRNKGYGKQGQAMD